MRAGRLRHRLQLYSKEYTQNSYGEAITTITLQGTVWGAIEPLSGKEYFAQQQVQAEAEVRIVLRFYSGIDESWVIKHDGKYYDIVDVLNHEERDRMLTVMCRQGVSEDHYSETATGDSFLLLETGDFFLLETGDKLILDGI